MECGANFASALLLIAPGRPGAVVRLPDAPSSILDTSFFEMAYGRILPKTSTKESKTSSC